jgi:AraC-like DNA-binding protein
MAVVIDEKHKWLRKLHTPLTYPHLYLALAIERGATAEQVLAKAGLSPATLNDPSGRMTPLQFGLLIMAVIELTGDHGIGFEMGSRLSLTAHGNLGYALLCCSTLTQAMDLVDRFGQIRTRSMSFEFRVNDERAILSFKTDYPLPAPLDHVIMEALLSSIYRCMQLMMGSTVIHGEILLTQAEPQYFAKFRDRLPRVRFDMPANQIILPHHLMLQPLPMSNPDSLAVAIAQCERDLALFGDEQDDTLMRARAAMVLDVTGYPLPDAIAERLYMSPRTLRRKLQNHGSNYKKLLDDVRRRDALTLLDNPDIEIQKIAALLGYENPANFTRAFKAWTGKTPSGYRSMLAASAMRA